MSLSLQTDTASTIALHMYGHVQFDAFSGPLNVIAELCANLLHHLLMQQTSGDQALL